MGGLLFEAAWITKFGATFLDYAIELIVGGTLLKAKGSKNTCFFKFSYANLLESSLFSFILCFGTDKYLSKI